MVPPSQTYNYNSAPDKNDNKDNLGIISQISLKNIFCDPSLETSHRDGSNEGSQHVSIEK